MLNISARQVPGITCYCNYKQSFLHQLLIFSLSCGRILAHQYKALTLEASYLNIFNQCVLAESATMSKRLLKKKKAVYY